MGIHSLQGEIVSLEQRVQTQTETTSKLTLEEQDLQGKIENIAQMNIKCKEMEGKWKRMTVEMDVMRKESAENENKMRDFGKLQDNLCQYKANEKEYGAKIEQLELKNVALKEQIERLQQQEIEEGDDMQTKGQFVSFREDVQSSNTHEGMTVKTSRGFGYNAIYK